MLNVDLQVIWAGRDRDAPTDFVVRAMAYRGPSQVDSSLHVNGVQK